MLLDTGSAVLHRSMLFGGCWKSGLNFHQRFHTGWKGAELQQDELFNI